MQRDKRAGAADEALEVAAGAQGSALVWGEADGERCTVVLSVLVLLPI